MTVKMPEWTRGFHEAPLALFSAAAAAGAGIAAARPLAWVLGLGLDDPGKGIAAGVLALICAGLLISTLHLGRPSQMMRVFRNAGRNPLGTEVAFAVLTAAGALGLLCLPGHTPGAHLIWAFASVAALGLLASLAWVYWLPSQLVWTGIPTLSVIPMALLFGLAAHAVTALPHSRPVSWSIVVLIALDAAAWEARFTGVGGAAVHGGAAYPAAIVSWRWIHDLRFILFSLPSLVLALAGSGPVILAPMGLGILLDRFAFYLLAVKKTTEREISRVESLL